MAGFYSDIPFGNPFNENPTTIPSQSGPQKDRGSFTRFPGAPSESDPTSSNQQASASYMRPQMSQIGAVRQPMSPASPSFTTQSLPEQRERMDLFDPFSPCTADLEALSPSIPSHSVFTPPQQDLDVMSDLAAIAGPAIRTPLTSPGSILSQGGTSGCTQPQALTGSAGVVSANVAPEGVLLARVSARSIFARDWKPAFWIIINHRLWIYRCKADFDPHDYIHNPFNERIKKSIHLRDNLRFSEIKSKVYPGDTKPLCTFGVNDMDEDGGKSLIAKFASYEYVAAKKLRDELERRTFELRHSSK